MFKNKTVWIAIIALIAGAGLYGYYILTTINDNQDAVAQSSSLETAVARTGDLSITASGSGEVVPTSEIGLTFDESGVVIEVLVSVGEHVKTSALINKCLCSGRDER